MYNKGTIIPGLIIFVLLMTFPLWFNAFSRPVPCPNLSCRLGGKKSVLHLLRKCGPTIWNCSMNGVMRSSVTTIALR